MYSFGHYLTVQNGAASFLQIAQIFALEAFMYPKKKLFFTSVHVWALFPLTVPSPVLPTYTRAHSASRCTSPVFAHGNAQYI